jgi:hypothetical protein
LSATYSRNSRFSPEVLNLREDILKVRKQQFKPNEAAGVLRYLNNGNYDEYQRLAKAKHNGQPLKQGEISIMLALSNEKDLRAKKDIKQLSKKDATRLLRKVLEINGDLFIGESSYIKKHYPLIPLKKEDYCTFVNNLAAHLYDDKKLDERSSALFNRSIKKAEKNISMPDGLSNHEQKVLKLATAYNLALGKHPSLEPQKFVSFLEQNNFKSSEINDTCLVVNNQNWFETLKKSADKDSAEQTIAFTYRKGRLFEVGKILEKSKLKPEEADDFQKHSANIDNYIKQIQASKLLLPITRIPKASQLKNTQSVNADGVENKIIRINKNTDFEKLGFDKGTNADNFYGFAHTFDLGKFDSLGINGKLCNLNLSKHQDFDFVISAAFIDVEHHKPFRKNGLMLDVPQENILAGYYRDFASEFKKTQGYFQKEYMFGEKHSFQNYYVEPLKKSLGRNDDEYVKLVKNTSNCVRMQDFKNCMDNDTFSKFESFTKNIERENRANPNRKYNEVFVSKVTPQAVFAYDQEPKDIPLELRKYAQDNDLPILIFEEPKAGAVQ